MPGSGVLGTLVLGSGILGSLGTSGVSERRRIVTLSSTGTVATVKDLEDLTTYYSVKNTFTVKPPDRQTSYAQQSRRYGGSRAVSESHGNAAISFQTIVKGASTDVIMLNAEALVGVLEDARRQLFFEWRPDGATNSTYFEIRGPATWNPTYQWGQIVGGRAMPVDFTIPVAPLARGDYQTVPVGALTLPASTSVTIPGDAPALVDVSMTHSGGAATPIWAMLGWHAPTASAASPSVGVREAESGSNLIGGWASTADAAYRGGNGLKATAAGAAGYIASYNVGTDMEPDEWAYGAGLDVWARVQIPSTLVSPKMTAWTETAGNVGLSYATPWGSAGKLITPPSSGTVFRFVQLGTVTMADPSVLQTLRVMLSVGASSSGVFGMDYLVLVPARARALGPTAKANDASYPDFLPNTSSHTRLIRSDLSGLYDGAMVTGLGGSPIEMEPGANTLVIKYSSLVPDDPTIDTTTEQLSHALTACSLGVWPRYWLARGA